MESIHDIFLRNNTDKNYNFHNYSRQYEELFKSYRDKNIAYLEIGIFNGGSLRAMRDVFKNATKIVGVDITPGCKVHENIDKNIYVEIMDATEKETIDYIISKYGKFDVILDDGSHTNRDVIKSFELLYPLLNDDGLYVIEDTICYKHPGYLISGYPDHLSYFFQYTKYLNQWRFDSTEGHKDHCIDPFKIMKKTDCPFEQSIDKIEYGCSYIAIYKKVRQHWIK